MSGQTDSELEETLEDVLEWLKEMRQWIKSAFLGEKQRGSREMDDDSEEEEEEEVIGLVRRDRDGVR